MRNIERERRRPLYIMKFGGTSVSSAKSLKTIVDILKKQKAQNPIVVVSAVSRVTDLLLSLLKNKGNREIIMKQIENLHLNLIEGYYGKVPTGQRIYILDCLKKVNKLLNRKVNNLELQDEIISFGEIMSSYIIANILNGSNISARQIIASSLIVTNDHFSSAEFLPNETKEQSKKILMPLVKKGIVPVVTGFIGQTRNGKVTTLGRGGSDYTAAILGFSLSAKEIQIWTDVDGIFTSDPKLIKEAKLLSDVSYKEASELAAFGAKVLHPRTIRPAIFSGIPVRVLNTFNPTAPGTVIKHINKKRSHIVAIASKRKITLVTICSTDMLLNKGFLARVFSIFSKYNISIDLVSVSEVSISASLDNDENLQKAIKELETFTAITTTRSLGMISLIGEKIVNVKNILKEIFSILDNSNIEVKMISLGATDINISLVLPSLKIDKSVNLLHKALIKKEAV